MRPSDLKNILGKALNVSTLEGERRGMSDAETLAICKDGLADLLGVCIATLARDGAEFEALFRQAHMRARRTGRVVRLMQIAETE
ncbi:hypothetical protein L1787_07635 [Acuticoccus sp. M5D2P5]|uniref:hypothetical protein n=1 Tax=Acuticoccus kalidii TaxID=2910977 RepID=UPI001F3E5407|nr:hypothetical protein [Acuticoccus kalidii]MCF3933281.1 hypothetical protein [Acuticoccus kalidii]